MRDKLKTFMNMAHILSDLSTCSRRAVGCILVDSKFRILATGYNGAPHGMNHCTSVPCAGANFPSGTGLDKCEAIHAEQNALLQCKDIDKIHACFTTTQPCAHCTKMLLNTSCEIIFYSEPYPEGAKLWNRQMEQI